MNAASIVVAAVCALSVSIAAQTRPAQPAQPAQPVQPAIPAAPTVPFIDDGRQSWSFWSDTGWTRLHVETYGRIELTDDERDVKSVSPDGSFELSARGWLSLFGRRDVVRGNPDGSVTRRFIVGASDWPIDSEVRTWIGDGIQRLAQQGFAAEARAARILAREGPTGMIDEISRLPDDFTKARYLRLLLAQSALPAETAVLALDRADREIGSDFEKSRLLIAAIVGQPHTPAVINAVLASATHIGSDFEKARVLRTLAELRDLPGDGVPGIIRAAGSIGSDFEKSRVLLQVIAAQQLDAGTRQTLMNAAGGIGSDHERGRVLAAMVRQGARH